MKQEDFKKMMQNRFSLNGKAVELVEERADYIEMQADISIPGVPLKLIDSLHWRKEEIDFCQSLENEKLQYVGYYHRTSHATTFDMRNFYFVITGDDGEKFPLYLVLYNAEGTIKIGKEKDFFFPKNEKHNDTLDVVKEELRILNELQAYYEPKFKESLLAK